MKKTLYSIFLLLFSSAIILGGKNILAVQQVQASTLCPANYTKQQCYDYLLKVKTDLQNQQKQLTNTINGLKSQENNLQNQINQINAQIKQNENDVEQKQIDIELTSIEITNIGDSIADTKSRIDTIKQETQNSLDTINEVALMSYKVNAVPSWYLLAQNDLISTLEMLRYYDYVAQQEKIRVTKFTNLQSQLASEEKALSDAQTQIIEKRNKLEAENLEIIKLRDTLTAQRDQQQKLLGQLAQQEKDIAAQKAALQAQMNSADTEAMAIAMQLFSSGSLGTGTPVKKGDIIGFQGHTGCSYGSHLHFGIIQSSNRSQYYANVNPISSGYMTTSGGYLYSGSGQVPYNGALITQWYHDGYYLDLVSMSEGQHNGATYYTAPGTLKCNLSYSGYNYLNGEGAPIRAMLPGTVYKGVDRFGGNFVIIDHGNNLRTAYYHLR